MAAAYTCKSLRSTLKAAIEAIGEEREGPLMILHMENFGLKSGEHGDATLPVLHALEACRELEGVTLLFRPGIYCFRPDNMYQLSIADHDQGGATRVAFPLEGRRRLTIDGAGAEFRFEGPMIPFVLAESHGVTLRDFTIDWERPMFAQGTVVESDEASFVVQLERDVPYVIEDGRLCVEFGGRLEPVWGLHNIDPESKTHVYQSGDRLSQEAFARLQVEEAGRGRIRVCGRTGHRPKVGSLIAIRFGRPESPGIFITGGSEVRVERVTVHHAPGSGLAAQRCADIRLHMFRVALRPGSDRIVTAAAGAASFTSCRGRIALEHCLFENQLDDALNVLGIDTADLTIRFCIVRANRALGLRIAAPGRALVEFNRISAPGTGIRLYGDAGSQYESGPVEEDVTIRRNTFGVCNYCHPDWGQAVIDIDPENDSQHRHSEYCHRRIVIEDNRFDTFGGAIVTGSSVDGFVFRYNRIRRSTAYPWHEDTSRPLVELTEIGDAEIGGNECPDDRLEGRVNGKNVPIE